MLTAAAHTRTLSYCVWDFVFRFSSILYEGYASLRERIEKFSMFSDFSRVNSVLFHKGFARTALQKQNKTKPFGPDLFCREEEQDCRSFTAFSVHVTCVSLCGFSAS